MLVLTLIVIEIWFSLLRGMDKKKVFISTSWRISIECLVKNCHQPVNSSVSYNQIVSEIWRLIVVTRNGRKFTSMSVKNSTLSSRKIDKNSRPFVSLHTWRREEKWFRLRKISVTDCDHSLVPNGTSYVSDSTEISSSSYTITYVDVTDNSMENPKLIISNLIAIPNDS